MDEIRGKIRNRDYAAQIRDFSGLKFGKITPTDIDGLIEYQDKGFVFIEAKYGTANLPYGQELALVRLCDVIQQNRPSLLIIARHYSKGDIDFAQMVVEKFRYRGIWHKEDKEITVKNLTDRFLNYLNKPSVKNISFYFLFLYSLT